MKSKWVKTKIFYSNGKKVPLEEMMRLFDKDGKMIPIEEMHPRMEYIQRIEIPEGVREIPDAMCARWRFLKSVKFPSTLEKIGSEAFEDCDQLQSVEMPSVNSIDDYAFFGCSALRDLKLPGNLGNIGENAFTGCDSLVDLVLPRKCWSIGPDAFRDCQHLRSVHLPALLCVWGAGAFVNCPRLETITWDGDPDVQLVDGALLSKSGKRLLLYPAGLRKWSFKVPDGVEQIDDGAFIGSYLTKLEMPDSVKRIGWGACSRMINLKEVRLPKNLKEIPCFGFTWCPSLESIKIPESVKAIGYDAFESCSKLANVDLPPTTKVVQGAFDGTPFYERCCHDKWQQFYDGSTETYSVELC